MFDSAVMGNAGDSETGGFVAADRQEVDERSVGFEVVMPSKALLKAELATGSAQSAFLPNELLLL